MATSKDKQKNILLLECSRSVSLFPDIIHSLCASAIRSAGHNCVRAKLYCPSDSPVEKYAEKLHKAVKKLSIDIVIYDKIFEPQLPQYLANQQSPPLQARLDAAHSSGLDDADSPFNLAITPTGGVRRNDTVFRITDASIETNVFSENIANMVAAIERFTPDLNFVLINDGKNYVSSRQFLIGDVNCRYRASVSNNRFFDSVEMDEENVIAEGCSFCSDRHNKKLPRAKLTRAIEQQLTFYGARKFIEEIFVMDEDFTDIIELVLNHPSARPGTTFFFRAGVRQLLAETSKVKVEKAFSVARQRGLKLGFYLIGFENFSDRELLLYNKGATSGDVRKVIQWLLRAQVAHSDVFTLTNSHGFILFNPWTSLEDLKENMKWLAVYEFPKIFCAKALQTKLRLNKRTPLYYLAMKDGLLTDKYEQAGFDSSKTLGYSPEKPWVFKDRNVGIIHQMCIDAKTMLKNVRSQDDAQVIENYVLELAVNNLKRENTDASVNILSHRIRMISNDMRLLLNSPLVFERMENYLSMSYEDFQKGNIKCAVDFFWKGIGLNPPPRGGSAPLSTASLKGSALFPAARIDPDRILFDAGKKPALYIKAPSKEAAESILQYYRGLPYHTNKIIRSKNILTGDYSDGSISGGPVIDETQTDVFIARSKKVLEAAVKCYYSSSKKYNAGEMGKLLGYPACCCSAFEKINEAGNNTHLMFQTILNTGIQRPAPENLALWQLAPHVPCSLACKQTSETAAVVLSYLQKNQPSVFNLYSRAIHWPVIVFNRQLAVVFPKSRKGRRLFYSGPLQIDLSHNPFFSEFGRDVLMPVFFEGDSVEIRPDEIIIYKNNKAVNSLRPYIPGLAHFLVY